jgi:hypothetical protein
VLVVVFCHFSSAFFVAFTHAAGFCVLNRNYPGSSRIHLGGHVRPHLRLRKWKQWRGWGGPRTNDENFEGHELAALARGTKRGTNEVYFEGHELAALARGTNDEIFEVCFEGHELASLARGTNNVNYYDFMISRFHDY